MLADTGAVAQVAGWWRDGEADLALFLEALPDPADGFDLARSYAAEGRSFGAHAWALGEALATIHSVLAERLGRSTVAGADIADGFRLRFAEVAATVPAVSRYADAAESLFAALPRGAVGTQRVHGDCHLAQALLSRGRWVYVDFEGEPMKPLAERRRPDSPLKDVAGMLRSFDYARDAGGAGPQWLRECRDSFLSGYGLDPSAQHGLLSAFETDKAAYEAAYEARYRPRLLHVPLDFFSTLP